MAKVSPLNNAERQDICQNDSDWQQPRPSLCKVGFFFICRMLKLLLNVRYRVQQGGSHNVPDKIIRRWYERDGIIWPIYKQLVDAWILFDNSGRTPKLIDEGEKV